MYFLFLFHNVKIQILSQFSKYCGVSGYDAQRTALGAVREWLPQISPRAVYFKNKLFCRFFFHKSFKPLLPPNACYALPLCSVVSVCLSLFVLPEAFLLLWPLFLFCPYTVTSVCNCNGQTAQKPFLFISLLVLSTYTFTFKTYYKKSFLFVVTFIL
jgi:hypothetical protein